MPLTREQADAQLKDRRAEWLQPLVKELKALPQPMRRVGRFIAGLKPDTEGSADWQERQSRWQEMVRQFGSFTDDARHKVLSALFPNLSELVEAGCQLKLRMPFQSGYSRRPFRAPGRPELYSETQLNWLQNLHVAVRGYREDIAWFARWAPWLSGYSSAESLGVLFAASIEAGNQEVREILQASARNEEEIGGMGRHVTRGLLCSSNPECWDVVSKLLLAAQREEGLRQVILETVDESHPGAFRAMLSTILEHDLGRFSSVVRALGTWMALPWDSVSVKAVNATLERLVSFLDDEGKCTAALTADDWEPWYEAAWVQAFRDTTSAIPSVTAGLKHAKPEMRYTAAYLGVQLQVPEVYRPLADALRDTDERVADRVVGMFASDNRYDAHVPDLFERAEAQVPRWRDDKEHGKPITWPWSRHKLKRAELCRLMLNSLGTRSPTRMLPYVDQMDPYQRANLCTRLSDAEGASDELIRTVLLDMVSDRSPTVREAAVKAVSKFEIKPGDAVALEALLRRKTPDVRRAVLKLLSALDDSAATGSARRLLASSQAQRLGGLELIRILAEEKRSAAQCVALAEEYKDSKGKLSADELTLLQAIDDASENKPTLKDALGLCDPKKLAKPPIPRRLDVVLMTPTAEKILLALDELVHEHRSVIVRVKENSWSNEYVDVPLGTLSWRFPYPDHEKAKFEAGLASLPLRDVWLNWNKQRPPGLRDEDGFEILRAHALWRRYWDQPYHPTEEAAAYRKAKLPELLGRSDQVELRYPEIVEDLIAWLWCLEEDPAAIDWILDAAETGLALCADAPCYYGEDADEQKGEADWRKHGVLTAWFDDAEKHRGWKEHVWSEAQVLRLYGLELALGHMGEFRRPSMRELLNAMKHGLASEHDLYDHLLGPRPSDDDRFWSLEALCGRIQKLNWLDLSEAPPPLEGGRQTLQRAGD